MNLFMISAPYQVLSALEAIHHLQLEDNHLRIIETGHFTRMQFDIVIDPVCWTSVQFHNFRYRMTDCDFGAHPPSTFKERLLELSLVADQAQKRWRANRITRAIGPVDHLVLGNYRRHYAEHMRHFANRLDYKHLYVLDVGTDTLRINQDRHTDKDGLAVTDRVAGTFKTLKQWIKRKLVDWDTWGVESLTFFTSYDLDLAPGDIVIRNSYAYLKSVVASARPSNKVLFVGQPLVDQCYITHETYMDVLSRIKAYFAGQELVYIPHPRESGTQLQMVRDQGITIERFVAPFEYEVSFSGERPSGIGSFFSSAVETSATIFGSTLSLWAFRLPESLLLKDQASVREVYSQFSKQAGIIEIVDLYY